MMNFSAPTWILIIFQFQMYKNEVSHTQSYTFTHSTLLISLVTFNKNCTFIKSQHQFLVLVIKTISVSEIKNKKLCLLKFHCTRCNTTKVNMYFCEHKCIKHYKKKNTNSAHSLLKTIMLHHTKIQSLHVTSWWIS